MVFKDFEGLKAALGTRGKKTAAVVCPDASALIALARCQREGILDGVLVGDQKSIQKNIAEQAGILGDTLKDLPVIHAPDPLGAAYGAVECIKRGEADLLLKGKLETSLLLKAVVDKKSEMRTGRLMSHLAFLKIPDHHKLIVLTDSGMVMHPTLDQKKQILENAVDALRKMGYDRPKVGVLAAVEKVNPDMPETLDAQELTRMNRQGEIKGCLVEGPYSYDILMSRESAEKKGVESELAGDPDILLAGDMTTGNILGKALVFSAKAEMAGIVVGARVPIALTSRGATEAEKYLSLILARSCA